MTSYTAAAEACIASSLKNQSKKRQLTVTLSQLDEFMSRHLGQKLDYRKRHKAIELDFIILWSLEVFCSIYTTISLSRFGLLYSIYIAEIMVPNHLLHMQCFQIYIFTSAIERRLNLITFCSHRRNVADVRRSLQPIFAVWKNFYECVELSLLLCMMELFLSLLINLFWLGLTGPNNEFDKVFGE